MFSFDPKLTIGTLLEIATIAVAFIFFLSELKRELSILKLTYDKFVERFDKLEKDVEQMAASVAKIAVQDERLKVLEGTVAVLQEQLQALQEIRVDLMSKLNSKPKSRAKRA